MNMVEAVKQVPETSIHKHSVQLKISQMSLHFIQRGNLNLYIYTVHFWQKLVLTITMPKILNPISVTGSRSYSIISLTEYVWQSTFPFQWILIICSVVKISISKLIKFPKKGEIYSMKQMICYHLFLNILEHTIFVDLIQRSEVLLIYVINRIVNL